MDEETLYPVLEASDDGFDLLDSLEGLELADLMVVVNAAKAIARAIRESVEWIDLT